MADSSDVIMSICDKQWSRALQWETHRAMMTNALLVGFALLQGFVVMRGFDDTSFALAVVMVVLGIYGAITDLAHLGIVLAGVLNMLLILTIDAVP